MQIHVEDALEYLIKALAKVPLPPVDKPGGRNLLQHGAEVWIPDLVAAYWRERKVRVDEMRDEEKWPYFTPFYDAAWELCRIGVLRPGEYAALGYGGPAA